VGLNRFRARQAGASLKLLSFEKVCNFLVDYSVQNGMGKGETMKKYVNELTALGRTSEPEVSLRS